MVVTKIKSNIKLYLETKIITFLEKINNQVR